MIRKTTLAVGMAFLIGAAILVAQTVPARGVPIDNGPCPPGWTCDCNSSVLEDVRCPRGDGTQGSVVVTICQKCPPPDCETPEGPCRIFPCEYSVSATCQ